MVLRFSDQSWVDWGSHKLVTSCAVRYEQQQTGAALDPGGRLPVLSLRRQKQRLWHRCAVPMLSLAIYRNELGMGTIAEARRSDAMASTTSRAVLHNVEVRTGSTDAQPVTLLQIGDASCTAMRMLLSGHRSSNFPRSVAAA